jgi:hypothetical protein
MPRSTRGPGGSSGGAASRTSRSQSSAKAPSVGPGRPGQKRVRGHAREGVGLEAPEPPPASRRKSTRERCRSARELVNLARERLRPPGHPGRAGRRERSPRPCRARTCTRSRRARARAGSRPPGGPRPPRSHRDLAPPHVAFEEDARLVPGRYRDRPLELGAVVGQGEPQRGAARGRLHDDRKPQAGLHGVERGRGEAPPEPPGSGARATIQSGVGTPASRKRRFEISLSIESVHPTRSLPTKGTPARARRACTVPSSPAPPWSTGKTRSHAAGPPGGW